MTKKIIIYILFAACFLSACRSDYYDSIEPVNEAANEVTNDELTLTVCTSDIVVSDGVTSRADDQGLSTVFKDVDGDCVGLIVLDKEGRLLVDNVPYKYNGSDWLFDAENAEGKPRVYYDATMWKYIVYYPYDRSVDGVSDVSALKKLSVFEQQFDQSEKRDYRFSDLMVWTYEGDAIRDLPVDLKHVRNSFSLDIKLNWELPGLPSDNYLEYRPLREALVDFKVRLNDGTTILNNNIDSTYHANDRSFRYILPDGYSGEITWRYTYRGESYGGESDVSAEKTGVRYVQHTIANISPEKAETYDYYSYKKINGENYGFVMPWDAAECFETYKPIGIVFYVGKHSRDNSDYTGSGIGQKECRGYVVALADAFLPDAADPTKPIYKLPWAKAKTDADTLYVTERSDITDWSGYENLIIMRNFAKQYDIVDGSFFPAEYACETYVGSDNIKGAPLNTSGWFLPTYNMLNHIMTDKKFEESFKPVFKYADTTKDDPSPDKPLFDSSIEGYWSSTESDWTEAITERHTEIKYENGKPVQKRNDKGELQYDKYNKPIWETVEIVDVLGYKWTRAYFHAKDNNELIKDKSATKFVRPVLAF